MHSRIRQARADAQRRRIVHLLEELAEVDHQEQCPDCGEYFKQVGSHRQHCKGPEL